MIPIKHFGTEVSKFIKKKHNFNTFQEIFTLLIANMFQIF